MERIGIRPAVLISAALAALALLSACNPQDARNLGQDVRSLGQHTGHALGSASVAARVNTVLSLRKGVDMSGLHVEAKGGIVTVGGHVRDLAEKRRVLDTVNGTRGVDRVIDQLDVNR